MNEFVDRNKNRYGRGSIDSIILLLQPEVISYFDWMNPSNGIRKL